MGLRRNKDGDDHRAEALWGDYDPADAYHTVEVAAWSHVERVANYGDRLGWRLHTVRDGIRGHGIDLGYRLIFERKQA